MVKAIEIKISTPIKLAEMSEGRTTIVFSNKLKEASLLKELKGKDVWVTIKEAVRPD